MTRSPKLQTREQERDARRDKEIGRRRTHATIGTVLPGRMDEIYGDLVEISVKELAGRGYGAFYVLKWKSTLEEGTMFTRVRRCWVYHPHSLDWEDHVGAGITYICVDSDFPV